MVKRIFLFYILLINHHWFSCFTLVILGSFIACCLVLAKAPCLKVVILTYTVDSLIFVGYQFSWISWVQGGHEFKSLTIYKFPKGIYADFFETMKLNIEYASFP